jgi:hypothetical protein
MAYIKPESVLSPKAAVSKLNVLHNNGDWSVAELEWNGKSALGLRWNGSDQESGCGTPQSRGLPTWFIVPDELANAIKEELPEKTDLDCAYLEMANDGERESEALNWCNALIGDSDNAAG